MTKHPGFFTNSDIEKTIRNMEGGDTFLNELYESIKISILNRISASVSDMGGLDLPNKNLDVALINNEIYSTVKSIMDTLVSTKDELKAISELAQERDVDGFTDVEDTLVAIVNDTERATNVILDNVDKITEAIDNNASPNEHEKLNDYIQRVATDIILACSFQDITGQRIQKIVDVINEVDTKIHFIESKLSNNSTHLTEYSREDQKRRGLLNGPALPNSDSSVTQNDIDDLFK